ncbi:hypothetical protein [Iningainema tapete]|nr:hypothetical protein [Iningainema tapete]
MISSVVYWVGIMTSDRAPVLPIQPRTGRIMLPLPIISTGE